MSSSIVTGPSEDFLPFEGPDLIIVSTGTTKQKSNGHTNEPGPASRLRVSYVLQGVALRPWHDSQLHRSSCSCVQPGNLGQPSGSILLLWTYDCSSLQRRGSSVEHEYGLNTVEEQFTYPPHDTDDVCVDQPAALLVAHSRLKLIYPNTGVDGHHTSLHRLESDNTHVSVVRLSQ